MSHFSDNFDHLLGFHRVTNERAAELLGVSRTTISNWRQGHKEPNLSSVIKLAEVFEIDPVRFTQLPFVELLGDLVDEARFIRVEGRIYERRLVVSSAVTPIGRSSDAGSLEKA